MPRGGYVDGDTAAALAAAGRNVFDTLQNNDAYPRLAGGGGAYYHRRYWYQRQ